MAQRVSEERLALLQEAHSSVSISGPGAWDGMDLNALVADLRDSRAEVAALKEASDEDERLRARMADLLTRTAAALKGDPGPLHLHDWADLPQVAAALKARLAAAEQVVEAAKSMRATVNASPADADFGAAAQAWDEGRDELMAAVDALAALRAQGDAGGET